MPVTILNTGTFNPGSAGVTAGLAAASGASLAASVPARIRHVGAALGFGTAGDQTPSQFLSVVGGSRYAVGHFFFGAAVPASLAASGQGLPAYAGVRRALVDFELTHYGVSGTYGAGGTPAGGAVTDASALGTFIASCQSGGLDLTICLWHEPYNKFNTQGTAAGNNLDYCNSMGYYGAVLRAHGIPVTFDPTGYSIQNHNSSGDNPIIIGTSGTPGLGWSACAAGYIDEVLVDFYVNQQGTGSQGSLTNAGNLAAAFGLPLGFNEIGYAPADGTAYSSADTDAFTSYFASYLSSWVSGGGQLADIIVWATNDNATTAGMYLSSSWSSTTLTRYQAMFDTYDGGSY